MGYMFFFNQWQSSSLFNTYFWWVKLCSIALQVQPNAAFELRSVNVDLNGLFQKWCAAKRKQILNNENSAVLVWQSTYSTLGLIKMEISTELPQAKAGLQKRSSSQIPQPLSATVTKIQRFQKARQMLQSKDVQNIRKQVYICGWKACNGKRGRKGGRERMGWVEKGWEGEREVCCADGSSKINANHIGIEIT